MDRPLEPLEPFDLERYAWRQVMAAIARACRDVGRLGRRCVYSHGLIVALYLWSVWHRQCLSWACDPHHTGRLFRPRRLPSISQFTRRVKAPATQLVLQRVHALLAAADAAPDGGIFDGKAAPVSPVSKDPDAATGHVPGGFATGYKLHAFVTRRKRIAVWSVAPLNVAEQTVAVAMVPHLPAMTPTNLSLADGNYDAAPLHKALGARDAALVTPLKGQARVKGGRHHPVTLRQMGPERRALVAAWQQHPDLTRFVLGERVGVETVFSVLTVALDLHLPAWVRRLERVRRWIGGKIILYHARLLAQEARASAAG